jgi:predicted house-cleaning noncanonical NTP pyrophosphatase (MazG superfamily)
MIIKNKLVRNLIPKIITNKGQIPETRILNDEDFKKELDLKLKEEVTEYLTDDNCDELADIMEVVYAIASTKGVSEKELDEIRLKKKQERGGFEEKIFLVGVQS